MAKLVLTGQWKELERALKAGRFDANIRREVHIALYHGASELEKAIKKNIGSAKYGPLAPLTVHIKGSETPLADTGQMRDSIHVARVAWNHMEIGISSKAVRSRPGDRGESMVEIAKVLHEGTRAPIIVTDRMLKMFKALYIAGKRKRIKLYGRAAYLFGRRKTGWQKFEAAMFTIPGRPFIKDACDSIEVQEKIRDRIEKALSKVFRR